MNDRATTPARREGYVRFRGHRTWYCIVGADAPGRAPLLCLHGGPGVPHDYLESLDDLAGGRRIVFYDQLGCGNSDHPDAPELWSVELFVDELATVRAALGFERVHLLGQSWGGMLAMEYALRRPAGIVSLVLANTLASYPQFAAGTRRLRAALPAEVRATLDRHEAAGTTDSAEYRAAMMVFYRRHICRLDPWPPELLRALDKLTQAPQVYVTLNGPAEFHATGRLKDWDISARLAEIRLPTLVLGGRHDEVTPEVTEAVHRGIPGSEYVLFEQSSHMPHLEERARFMALVGDFVARAEARRG